MKIHHTVTGLFLTSLLVACGGGGGGSSSPPVPPVPPISTSFPFQSAISMLIANGYTKTYTISGDCTGTATDTATPAAAATSGAAFGSPIGQQSVQQMLTINFTNCTPPSSVSMATSYYDSNYTPQGSEASAVSRRYLTPPAIPASVVFGSSGSIGTLTNYDRSSNKIGTTEVSFIVVPVLEMATTAILNLTYVNYDNAGTVISTEQDRYRMGTTGALTPISIDILQNVTAGSRHLIFQ
jgi:hypothetical protein